MKYCPRCRRPGFLVLHAGEVKFVTHDGRLGCRPPKITSKKGKRR